jgi:DNA-binding beta-propeller fold protein YncE
MANTVTVNQQDGSVWVTEYEHPDVPGSLNRILIVELDGRVRKQFDHTANAIVLDEARNTAWVVVGGALTKVDFSGQELARMPLEVRSLFVEPDTGYVWVTDDQAIYRLDSDGHCVWSERGGRDWKKWLALVER